MPDKYDAQAASIKVRGARVHNLRDVDVDIPHDSLVVITGLSGSGKSSLAFDTLFAEGQRRYLESLSTYTRQFLNQLERPDVDLIEGLPPTISVDQRMAAIHLRSTLGTTTEIHDYLRVLYARAGQAHCPQCGRTVSQQSPQAIVNQILAMEERRKVMIIARLVTGRKGQHREVFERICKEGFVRARVDGQIVDAADPPQLASTRSHDVDVIIDRIVIKDGMQRRIQESVDLALKHGSGACLVSSESGESWQDRLFSSKFNCPHCQLSLPDLEPRTFSFNSPQGACPQCSGIGYLVGQEPADSDDEVGPAHASPTCPECRGSRLGPVARAVTVSDVTIQNLTAMAVGDAEKFIGQVASHLEPHPQGFTAEQALAARSLLPEISNRIGFLRKVGLAYLTLDRATRSLSGGEFQRARLASCLGSGLTGVCYILDEPTVGLHPRDTGRMIGVLQELRDQGNTVVVVEHDFEMIRCANFVIDLGPGAGHAGGHVVATGTPEEIATQPDSLTGNYLADTAASRLSDDVRQIDWEKTLELTRARLHNLRDVSLRVPLGIMTVVTGVSGSGKTSLISQTLTPAIRHVLSNPTSTRAQPAVDPQQSPIPLLPSDNSSVYLKHPVAALDTYECIEGVQHIDRIVEVDQSAIGRTGRSNPATYCGVWNEVRKLFARTRDARIRGYRATRFSFNAKSGRCDECSGYGSRRIEMHFLPDLFVECPSCRGARFNRQTLGIRFRGKSVADVLRMQIDEALEFFQDIPKIQVILRTLVDVGLGYLCLGQSSLTLSGGEAQRIRLATELGRRTSNNTLFVLDEPTTGLHAVDVRKLINLLNQLIARGDSVLVIEHQLDLIAAADWIIEMGPEGGEAGGRIVDAATPRQLAGRSATHTGRALSSYDLREHSGS